MGNPTGCSPAKSVGSGAMSPRVGECSECGERFESRSAKKRFCSTRCRDLSRRVPCAFCGELMHLGSTSRPPGEAMHNRCMRASVPHGVSRYNTYGCRCAECRSAASVAVREWTRKNNYWSKPEVVKRRRKLRSSPDAQGKERTRWVRYYAENRPALIAAAKAKDARRKGAPTISFTVEQLEARMSMFAGCWMCGDDVSNGLHVDHVKPLSRGGWHCLSNLRPSCPSCNLSKGAKWPLEKVMLTV